MLNALNTSPCSGTRVVATGNTTGGKRKEFLQEETVDQQGFIVSDKQDPKQPSSILFSASS